MPILLWLVGIPIPLILLILLLLRLIVPLRLLFAEKVGHPAQLGIKRKSGETGCNFCRSLVIVAKDVFLCAAMNVVAGCFRQANSWSEYCAKDYQFS